MFSVLTFLKESVLASGDGYTVSTWVALSAPCSGIIMRSQIKVAQRTAGNVSEYALSRQAQALSLENADRARAEKRRINDERIDSNASKWRYSAPLAES
jgi:predicted NAD/FAD-dependent oxidoreductase